MGGSLGGGSTAGGVEGKGEGGGAMGGIGSGGGPAGTSTLWKISDDSEKDMASDYR
jgi:hypothetical protein